MMVSTIGSAMHAILPALPMMNMICDGKDLIRPMETIDVDIIAEVSFEQASDLFCPFDVCCEKVLSKPQPQPLSGKKDEAS